MPSGIPVQRRLGPHTPYLGRLEGYPGWDSRQKQLRAAGLYQEGSAPDRTPPSPHHLQRVTTSLEEGSLRAFSKKLRAQSLSRVRLFATPWTAAHQAPPPMGFPGKSTEVGRQCLLLLRSYRAQKIESSRWGRQGQGPGSLKPPKQTAERQALDRSTESVWSLPLKGRSWLGS